MNLKDVELVVDAKFLEFCNVFESETVIQMVLNYQGEIIFKSQAYLTFLNDKLNHLSGLEATYPNIETLFDLFQSSNTDYDKNVLISSEGIEWRKFEYKKSPLVLVTIRSNQTKKIKGVQNKEFRDKNSVNNLFSNRKANFIDTADIFKELVTRSIAGIIVLRTNNLDIVSMNSSAQRILGINQQELSQDPMKLFLNEFNQNRFIVFLKGVNANGNGQLNFQIYKGKKDLTYIKIGAYSIKVSDDEFIVLGFMDTTDSVKRKLDYQQQSMKLKAFADNNVLPLAMFDVNMNYMLVDKKWLEIYSADNVDDLIGRNYYECHPNIPQRWRLAHMKAMSGTTVSNLMDHHVQPNGREEWFKWLAKPWYKSKDVIGGIIVYAEIITSEVEASLIVKNQDIRYKRFFENSSIGWIEVEAIDFVDYCYNTPLKNFKLSVALKRFEQSKVINFNDQIREIFGLSVDDEKFNPANYFREGLKYFVFKLINGLQNKQEIFEHEISVVNAKGEQKSLFVSVRLPDNKDISHVVFGVLDITDLKSSVTELRESEERYRTIFDSNSFGVIYTNDKKSIVRVNPAFTKMLGYTEKEMQMLDEMDLLYPKYRQDARDQISAFKSGRLRQVKSENEYKRKNGKRLIASTDTSALYDHEGRYYGMVKIIEDISERKLDEQRIKKQNKELIKINQELDKFVYSAAHDLRAPIANVLGLIKLLKLENLSDNAFEYVHLQEKSLEKLDEFIMGIVDYSRNSRTPIDLEQIDLRLHIEQTIAKHGFLENADKIEISLEVTQSADFWIDQRRLDIILNNFISNAIKYADLGKAQPKIEICVEANNKIATIVIKDNGIGIDAKHKNSIFDLFYRASSDSKGTGIGLYLVKEAVTKLKGSISVDSQMMIGTTFKVQLKNYMDSILKSN